MPIMAFRRSHALGLALAGQFLSACGPMDTGKPSGSDFNPLPDSAEYVYAKEIRNSSGMSPGWSCIDTVRINPVREAAAPGSRRFLDSSAIHCTVVAFKPDGSGATDTIRSEIVSLDTLSFSESSNSLAITGAEAFLNVGLPPGILPGYPDGLLRTSKLITGTTVSFPKRDFPLVRTPDSQNAAENCGYIEGGQTTSCRKLIDSDFRYQSESLAFLQDVGFISLQSAKSSAPLGTGPTESGSIRLLYRVLRGDTVWYNGTVSP